MTEAGEPPVVLIRTVTARAWGDEGPALAAPDRGATAAARFEGKAGQVAVLCSADGVVDRVLAGLGDGPLTAAAVRALAARLPRGLAYRFDPPPAEPDGETLMLAWAAGCYRFDRYRAADTAPEPSLWVEGVHSGRQSVIAAALARARDMINTPASDMGPGEIEQIAREIAAARGAALSVTAGDALAAGYPAVHAVGRAASQGRAPRFVELAWGDPARPSVVVIGKGVAFDTGGLDLKPSAGMRWMKKDMGGAAHALALGDMIMGLSLAVRLHVLLPLVENVVAADAMRPGDVLASRRGLSIEIGNTDAEGRLILADALTRAGEFAPDLTVDLATLTGAARVALGPDVVPFYTRNEPLARALAEAATALEDPLWRMPLWTPYAAALDSDVADLKNDADAWAQAGSITAALFLERFAPAGAWVHFDLYAWNGRSRPGFPQGAEAQAIRAILAVVEARYGR